MPSQTPAHQMIAGIETIAAERGQVDTPDERDLAVHDDELLVVAVHRALVEIKRALNARAADQLLAHVAHGRARRREDRKRRSPPQQYPDLHSLGQLGEKIAQPRRLIVARQPEIGGDMPPGDMHMRASAGERLGDARQRLPAVDQHVKRAPRARRRVAVRPQPPVTRRSELIDSADTAKAATMMGADRGLDAAAHPAIRSFHQGSNHDRSLRAGRAARIFYGRKARSEAARQRQQASTRLSGHNL